MSHILRGQSHYPTLKTLTKEFLTMAKKTATGDPGQMSSVFDLIKSFDDSAEIIADSAYSNIKEWIPSGNYILNACMSGDLFKGLPSGRTISLIGEEGTGKSYLQVSFCREAQKLGWVPVILDSEGAIDSTFVERLGVDPKNCIIKQVNTIFETNNFISNLAKSLQEQQDKYGEHQKVILVLDSLGNLTSSKERDDTMAGEQKRDMTKAQEIRALFRVNQVALSKLQIPWIVIGHVYACLSKDAEVLMADNSTKNINEVSIGEKVMTLAGPRKVESLHEYEVKNCIHFVFEDSTSLTCTPNHMFAQSVEDGGYIWVEAANLIECDTVVLKDSHELRITSKTIIEEQTKVYDLTVSGEHTYFLKNGIISHNSNDMFHPGPQQSGGGGIKYNSSITLLLSTRKLEDKENDAAAGKNIGNTQTKNGILVSVTPKKSRFCVPNKVSFQIPFFKAPNPYVGLEQYLNWENAGVCRGNVLDEKAYAKLNAAEQAKCHEFEHDGQKLWCQPKDNARGMAVKHLGRQVSFIEFFSDVVFTDDYLHEINERVIKPIFQLPSRDAFDDIKDVEETLGIDQEDEETTE